jgi:hypothetical protein
LTTIVAGAALIAGATADTYWIQYNAADGLYPEEVGWTRHRWEGGDERWLEDGWLVLDGLSYPGFADWYEPPVSGPLNPSGPDEVFVAQWRIRVDAVLGDHDPFIAIFADDEWSVAFDLSTTRIYSGWEPGVSAPFEPNSPHTFDLQSSDMRTYVLLIDGVPAIEGAFWLSLMSSTVQWGDGWYPPGSLARWQYFGFGVVNAPLVGDVNCDGTVDFRDINPFVQALIDPNGFTDDYPGCWPENADINADGSVNFGDINPFIELLIP